MIVVGRLTGGSSGDLRGAGARPQGQGDILEGPYQDLRIAAWNRTEPYLPSVLDRIGYEGLWLVRPMVPPDLDKISPIEAIDGILTTVPVLILAGEADYLARPGEARALLDRVAGHGRLVLFPGAGHHNLFPSAPHRYRRMVLDLSGAPTRRLGRQRTKV